MNSTRLLSFSFGYEDEGHNLTGKDGNVGLECRYIDFHFIPIDIPLKIHYEENVGGYPLLTASVIKLFLYEPGYSIIGR